MKRLFGGLLSYHNANYNYHVLTRGHTVKLKKNAFRLDVARNHFCNRVVSVWNGLPEHVVTAASLTLFKKYLRTIYFSSYIKFDRNLQTLYMYHISISYTLGNIIIITRIVHLGNGYIQFVAY